MKVEPETPEFGSKMETRVGQNLKSSIHETYQENLKLSVHLSFVLKFEVQVKNLKELIPKVIRTKRLVEFGQGGQALSKARNTAW